MSLFKLTGSLFKRGNPAHIQQAQTFAHSALYAATVLDPSDPFTKGNIKAGVYQGSVEWQRADIGTYSLELLDYNGEAALFPMVNVRKAGVIHGVSRGRANLFIIDLLDVAGDRIDAPFDIVIWMLS